MSLPDNDALCLISGTLCDLSGKPRRGIPVVVRNLEDPLTHGTALVGGADVRVKSGGDGSFSLRLLRGAQVMVDHPHRADLKLERIVPDLASIDFIAWLFPHIVTLRNDGGDYEATVGQLVEVNLVAELSDGTEVAVPPDRVTFDSSDEGVVTGTESGLHAAGLGEAVVGVTAVDQGFLPTNQLMDGTEIPRAGVPDPTLPDPFDVSVST